MVWKKTFLREEFQCRWKKLMLLGWQVQNRPVETNQKWTVKNPKCWDQLVLKWFCSFWSIWCIWMYQKLRCFFSWPKFSERIVTWKEAKNKCSCTLEMRIQMAIVMYAMFNFRLLSPKKNYVNWWIGLLLAAPRVHVVRITSLVEKNVQLLDNYLVL